MPEGDTVWLTARRMHEALAGRILVRTDFRVPALATADVAGRRVLEVVPRGKHMLCRFEGGLTLHTHLRMDGVWHVYRPGEHWTRGPGWQVRVVLETAERRAVGYRLPVVELVPTGEEDRVVGHLGPDVLGPDWSADRAVANLRARPDREIGLALLDQRNLAGIGNLYRTEVCFLRGVTPWTRVGDVPDLPALVRLAQRLVAANRGRPEQATTGSRQQGEAQWVFGREGRLCRRCGTRIERADQGEASRERVTTWCPHCQRGPAPSPSRAPRRRRPPAGERHYPG
ncbi:MAG TPA: DNA-formamidopyrimidine glycosylase family protein [Frankiaceae bacterium]|nr:DNA-formamidopyrimidine glycosylase family protein [Frankiaceae bacterium]